MPRLVVGLLALCALTRPALADRPAVQPAEKTIEEIWEAAYLEDTKAGNVHTVTRAVTQDGQQILRTSMELSLTVRRFNDTIRLRMLTGDEENAQGKVTGVFMKQYIGKEQALQMDGVVKGNRLQVRVNGANGQLNKQEPWNNSVVGLYRQRHLFGDKKLKPGDTFVYQSFVPEATTVMRVHVRAVRFEDVPLPSTHRKQRLLRVEEVPEKVEGVQLPGLTLWLDAAYEPVRSEVEMPGLGKLTLVRTTREVASARGAAPTIDIGRNQLIPLNRRIVRPYEVRSAVYRIRVKGDDDPASTFAQDDRQEIRNVDGDTFELHVHVRRPRENPDAKPAREEYLKSSYFINCADVEVKRLARQAVGAEPDPWRKALRIERWVHDHMQNKNYTEAFATSDHVAQTLEGDCTEHSVLAAAMCRAVGVPSRAAVGLLYVDDASRGPVMGFHMWSEVYVRGQWLPIDATLGEGFVDATHLKIADHSWYNVNDLKPLLPVMRLLGQGKVTIEVLRVE